MNRDEIVRAMSAITDAGEVLSAEQVEEYEKYEGQLKAINKTDELIARQAAWKSVNILPGAAQAAPEDDTITRGFDKYLRTGRADDTIQRAQGEGVAANGGFLVPEGFRAIIIERLKAFGGLQAAADSISTDSGQPLPWPTNDDTSNLGAIAAESANLPSGADLSFGVKMLGAYTYTSNGTGSAALKVPYELLQDSAFDLSGFVGRKLGERIARKLAVDFMNGTGAGEPTGLLSTAGGLSAASAWSSNSAPTYADFVNIVHSVDPAYRAGASWVFNDNVVKVIRKIVDTTGRPLLWDTATNLTMDLRGGQTLLGFPVIVDQAAPDPASGNHFGFFGDVSKAFIVRNVRDLSLVTLMEKYAENRQVGYMAWGRWDSVVQDTNAGVLMTAA